jgi:hypothetical protein
MTVFSREYAIGMILLALCAAVAGALIYEIVTGNRFRFTGPPWLGAVLTILFIAGAIYGFIIRTGRRWPWDRGGR